MDGVAAALVRGQCHLCFEVGLVLAGSPVDVLDDQIRPLDCVVNVAGVGKNFSDDIAVSTEVDTRR